MSRLFWHFVDVVNRRHFLIHLLLVIIALSVGIFIYFNQGISTQNALAEQVLHRQQVTARAGALSLEQFLNDFGKSLSIIARDESVIDPDQVKTTSDLKTFVDTWVSSSTINTINSISFLNTKGVVIYNYNTGGLTNYIGEDFSDREYFKWAVVAKKGDYYIGSPVIAKTGISAGSYIIPFSSPVIGTDGKFKGALITSIKIENIVEKYSYPLKISNDSAVFLLDSRGDFVFSPIPNLIGTNFEKVFGNIESKLTNEFDTTKSEGKLDVTMPNLLKDGAMTRFLLAYSVINLRPGVSWPLIILTPASDAFLFAGPFYQDQIVSLFYTIVVVIVFSIVGLTSYRIRERRRYK